ncbi:hypothetical protein DSO57_1029220 [Entomophthora muscae]|uniref:Uncharacterized protein n=1 Tax=Entomophthora muscae TaxID=34485 RepID=A0ACC2UAA5_9FUNG|nr:hypothetical protein DSO57_1029220 [Entomophthora muscae]
MPRNCYLIAGIVYFCSNSIILFESTWESTTQYDLAYPYPPGYTPAISANPLRALDLERFLLLPLPNVPPAQDFSKLGFVYITVLGLADQVVPHTGGWRPLATAVNYLVPIAPIVYMAFQDRPASPMGAQLDSGMGRDKCKPPLKLNLPNPVNLTLPPSQLTQHSQGMYGQPPGMRSMPLIH